MKNFISLCIAALLLASCSEQGLQKNSPSVPTHWYDSTQQGPVSSREHAQDDFDPEKNLALTDSVDALFAANAEALEAGDQEAQSFLSPLMVDTNDKKNKPKDWVPWRAEYFMTDLSLTASGMLGVLALKGTTTVRAFWRRQGPVQPKLNELENPIEETLAHQDPIIEIEPYDSDAQIMKQLEPAIRAAVATKKVQDTPDLRNNLLKAAHEFQTIASAIPANKEDLPWWVSRFRVDILLDAAGRVEPVGLVGGEVRFRFEWHRLRRTQKAMPRLMLASERSEKIRDSLSRFITATAQDLEVAFSDHENYGFKAHQMRMGIGITAKGNIGVVKGAASIVGQIYFTRHVERPIVRPRTLELNNSEEPIEFIDRNPKANELAWAQQNGISYEMQPKAAKDFTEVVYKIERKKFRQGLIKTAKIGGFFAKRASRVKPGSWRIYELRTAFDASIGGTFDLVTLAGTGTAQISMWNEKF